MSTKVYDAFRLHHQADFWQFVRDAEVGATHHVHKKLAKLHRRYMDDPRSWVDISGMQAWRGKNYEQVLEYYKKSWPEEKARLVACSIMAAETMAQGYKESIDRNERSEFNYDVSITFRELNGGVYVQLWSDMEMIDCLDFLRRDRRLSDYHFQNSTDGPKNVSARSWKKREKVWDTLYANDDLRKTFLSLTIMDWSEFRRWKYLWESKVADLLREGKFA